MKRFVGIFAVAGLVTAGAADAAIIPNTGTSGPNDPFWSVLWHGIIPSGTSFGSAAQAPLVTTIPSPPWQPNAPGNNWIGVASNATIAGSPSDGSHRYEYAFTTHVALAAPQLVTGAIGYDNYFVGGFIDGTFNTTSGVYTPGTQFLTPTALLGPGNESKSGFCRNGDGFLPSSSFPVCTVNFAFNLPAGSYALTFVIQGDGTTDAFLLNQRGISLSVPEPASLALVVIALAALWSARRAARRA